MLTAQHWQALIKHFDGFDDRLTVMKFHQVLKTHNKLYKDISFTEIRGIMFKELKGVMSFLICKSFGFTLVNGFEHSWHRENTL